MPSHTAAEKRKIEAAKRAAAKKAAAARLASVGRKRRKRPAVKGRA